MSPMGSSGGRSAGHRTGKGAIRRATQRERDFVEAPWEDQPPLPLYSPRAERLLATMSWLTLLAIAAIFLAVGFGWIDG